MTQSCIALFKMPKNLLDASTDYINWVISSTVTVYTMQLVYFLLIPNMTKMTYSTLVFSIIFNQIVGVRNLNCKEIIEWT